MNSYSLIPDSDSQDSERPLPLIVAEKWDFPLQHIETEKGLYYAIEDWIAGLTSEDDRRKVQKMWAKMKSNQMSTSSRHLPYVASADGKTYQKDFTDDNGLYLIAQNLRATKKRVALKEIKEFLAKAGVFADKLRTNQDDAREKLLRELIAEDPERTFDAMIDGYTEEGREFSWIKRRLVGMVRRQIFTQALKETVTTNPNFAAATNAGYEGAFEMDKSKLVKYLQLDEKQARKVRDFLSEIALQGISLYETAASEKMRQLGRPLTPTEQVEIVKMCAEMVAPTIQALAEYVGVDLISGKPLLESGKD